MQSLNECLTCSLNLGRDNRSVPLPGDEFNFRKYFKRE